MEAMNRPSVIPIADRRARVMRAVQAARHLRAAERRSGGRAWVNGRELGGPQARFAHLAESYD